MQYRVTSLSFIPVWQFLSKARPVILTSGPCNEFTDLRTRNKKEFTEMLNTGAWLSGVSLGRSQLQRKPPRTYGGSYFSSNNLHYASYCEWKKNSLMENEKHKMCRKYSFYFRFLFYYLSWCYRVYVLHMWDVRK